MSYFVVIVRRRFLIFDIMYYKSISLLSMPFKKRYAKLHEFISATHIESLQHSKKPFDLRRKSFFDIKTVKELVEILMPKPYHKSDGLIFQGTKDPYISGTFKKMFKWKFVELNTIDILLRFCRDGQRVLFVLSSNGELEPIEKEIFFPNKENSLTLDGCVIECKYYKHLEKLIFIKKRRDKVLPNSANVYRKILKSIRDNITEDMLFKTIDKKYT